MCHLDETLVPGFPTSIEARADLVAVGSYAAALAKAAERDDDAGLPGSWRRVHELLFGGGLLREAIAQRIEDAAERFGLPMGARPFSIAYADEIRGFAREVEILVGGLAPARRGS